MTNVIYIFIIFNAINLIFEKFRKSKCQLKFWRFVGKLF